MSKIDERALSNNISLNTELSAFMADNAKLGVGKSGDYTIVSRKRRTAEVICAVAVPLVVATGTGLIVHSCTKNKYAKD